MKYPIILIDNGHGKNTPGKCSPDALKKHYNSPYYLREFSWNRRCTQGIVDVLQAEGYTAFLLVKEEEDVSLSERAARVNAYCRRYGKENVLLVSVHVNAAGADGKWHDARGWGVYTSRGNTVSDTLATCLHAQAVRILEKGDYGAGFKKGGKQKPVRADYSDGDPDHEENFTILSKTACTAVLTENLFQDNKEDVEFLKSDAGLGALIELHVQGIEDFIGETFETS